MLVKCVKRLKVLTMFSCCQRTGPGKGALWPPGSSAPPVSAHPMGERGWGHPCGTRLLGASWGQLSGGERRFSHWSRWPESNRLHRTWSHQSWVWGVASALGPHQVQGFQGRIVIRGHPASRPGPSTHHWNRNRVNNVQTKHFLKIFNAILQ